MKTVVLVCHPNPSQSVRNKEIAARVQQNKNVTVRYISELIKNPAEEQEFIKQFQRIVIQFPVYWYQITSVGKDYVDRVLTKELLTGKTLKIVNTTGAKQKYVNAEIIHGPWKMMAHYCEMTWETPEIYFIDDSADKVELIAKSLE
ncbi:NADPH_oxidoreductase [Hexamita inflata]|uniref:NADPH oxidoreductase n=1 Tax=Hexamita inflata TaxID=28002 RepID=A0AA86PVW4_9EUKA|nr:NADPH oxidoreductase [Hexamita inflata]CAI9968068.1 NADPH oxidoreductase [Hexamita inflata]